ncbi:hypothetical protein EDB89DRAFT_2080999 [Lactarius sanguifluus]|nr:hypothetical protein EDB89DRAFT_2080999 [Lactarius sanguifluus]
MEAVFSPFGSGTRWCAFAADGEKSFLHRHFVSTSDSSARTERLWRRIWVAGHQPFPLPIDYGYRRDMSQSLTPDDEDNVFAALKQRERVRHLALSVTDSALLEEMVTLMQEPFPELRVLAISSQCQNVPVLPDDFLGGSAPRLQEIRLSGIPFPALPTLLASASNLVGLLLDDIPRTGHRISPAAFAACLAVLPRLKLLSIEFRSPPSRTGRTHLPPETRAVLPSLTSFMFTGESAFLEVILARVDAPQLDSINIRYTDRLEFNFQATEFSKFIERSAIKPTRFGHGEICLEDDDISFCYFRKTNPDLPTISIQIPFDQPITVIVVNMTQVLNQTSAILSDVVRLKVTMKCSSPFWRDDMSNHIRWLELFRPFTSVMKLRIYEELAESISHALEYREAGTQVLPALKLICVEDQRVRYMKELIAYLRERGKLPSNGNEGLDSDDIPASILKSVSPLLGLARLAPPPARLEVAPTVRLDLQLLCTHGTPVRKNLGCWPPTLPIVIGHGHNSMKDLLPEDEDNIFAALEQRDRVRHINLWVTYTILDNMVTLMQEPFPELRRLAISSRCQNMPILPDDFLCGSAPCLREISFCGIPFPALPTLLSSASDLVELILVDIPQTGHISSTAFPACLAVLPSLEHLSIELRSPGSPTDRIHLPPKTRAVLPSLTSFVFEGESAYLEVFLAQVDTPQLNWINIRYTDDLDFRVTEFPKFIERSVLKPSRFGHAEIYYGDDVIWFNFFHQTDLPTIAIRFLLSDHTSLIFDMARLLNQTSTMLSDVVRLEIRIDSSLTYWRDDIGRGLGDGTEWLELFRPFKAVKELHICEELAESITHALEGRTEADTRVLPALKSICVEDQQAKK